MTHGSLASTVVESPGGTLHTTLRDGTPVLIRPLRPGDRELLRAFYGGLSPETRYRRFMSAGAGPSDSQLVGMAAVQPPDHIAWVALDPAAPEPRALGVAELVRLGPAQRTAEVSVTVADAHQGRGLGTLLLAALSRSAVANGIDTFVAYVLSDNTPMLRIFRDMGATRAETIDTGVQQLEMPIPGDPRDLPHTPLGRVFRAVARGIGTGG